MASATGMFAPTRGRRTTALALPAFWYSLLGLNLALITAAWWSSSGFESVRSAADFFNGLGRLTGLVGTFLVLVQLLLMARLPLLEAAFGMERLARLHRANGWISMELIAAHAIFQTVGYMLQGGRGLLDQVGVFITQYEGLLAAFVGFGLMLVVVGTSIVIARLKLAYETWYFIHLYSYLGIAVAFSHQLQTGADFAGNPPFTAYWVGIYLVVLGALLWYRLATPLLRFRRHRFVVAEVTSEAPSVTSITVRGRQLAGFRIAPGQFLLWRFLDRRRWWQAHPFSVSGRGTDGSIRMTARQLGDFTATLNQLRPGTPVLLEGPFGAFTADAATATGGKVLLVAGGVGITPVRALAQEMVAAGYDVSLLFRARQERDLIFREELLRLAEEGNLKLHFLLTEPGPGTRAITHWFSEDSLARMVPDLRERDAFVCGPPAMTRAVLAGLLSLGVPEAQLHSESFRY